MMDEQDIYASFRRAQSNALDRGWRMPKDWEKHWETKFSPKQREIIREMKGKLVTTWQNIDIDRYFAYGFELWKGFTYRQWHDKRLFEYYVQKDKNIKRMDGQNKETIVASAKHIKAYLKANGLKSMKDYARARDGARLMAVGDYIKGRVDESTIVYMINKRYLILSDEDRIQIPKIVQKYREILSAVRRLPSFFSKIEERIGKGL